MLGRELFEPVEITQGDRDGHRVGTGKDVGLVVREHIGQAIIETALKQQ